jgi:hypothetical protein
LVTCAHELQIREIEAESTLLAMAISEALLEAFALGKTASSQTAVVAGVERAEVVHGGAGYP